MKALRISRSFRVTYDLPRAQTSCRRTADCLSFGVSRSIAPNDVRSLRGKYSHSANIPRALCTPGNSIYFAGDYGSTGLSPSLGAS